MGEPLEMGKLRFTGWQDYQSQKSSLNSYLASAPQSASYQVSSALPNGLKCTISCSLQDCNHWQEDNNTMLDSDPKDYSDDNDDEGLNCDIY